jgi:hypothetical protein
VCIANGEPGADDDIRFVGGEGVMVARNDPSSFLWRLVPIGFATVFAGAIAIVALGGILGRGVPSEAVATVAITMVAVSFLAFVMLAPMYVVWSMAFVLLRKGLPDPRHRAALSTCFGVVIGNGAVFAFLLRGAIPDGRTSAEMAMLTFFTTLVGVGLTWWAFRTGVWT